jgi:hypothetical protein
MAQSRSPITIRKKIKMAGKSAKRRSPGRGGAYSYKTTAGERWRVKGLVRLADGTDKEINKRGFMSKTEALDWLSDTQAEGRKTGFVEPSKQRLGAYGSEVIAGLRLKPQTRASYIKNWRNHVEAYPIAALPLGSGDRDQAHQSLPVAGEVRPEGLSRGRGPVGQDHQVRACDHPQGARPGRQGWPAEP